ncbi:MarR family transcriptional regulator [Kitasatospora nipponensis]
MTSSPTDHADRRATGPAGTPAAGPASDPATDAVVGAGIDTGSGTVTEGAADGVAELADELTRAIKRIRRRTIHQLEPYGITPGQSRALRVLAHAEACETPGRAMRLSELADRLNIAPRSATTVVDALEQAGLVERIPDPADRRAVGLALTTDGRAALERLAQVRQAVAEEYFSDTDPADVAVMLRVLPAAEAAHRAPAAGCGR